MSDIPFIIGDKSLAEEENEKLLKIQKLLEDSGLSPEDLTAISEAALQGAQDAMQDGEDFDQDTV